MKGFTRQWIEPELQRSVILFILVIYSSIIVGIIVGVSLHSWIVAIASGGVTFLALVTCLCIVYLGAGRSTTVPLSAG